MAISRRLVVMHVGGSNTVTTSVGANCVTKTNSVGSPILAEHYQRFGGESLET
jgi:hypothetical protein